MKLQLVKDYGTFKVYRGSINLKKDMVLKNANNDGKSPFDTDWDINAYVEMKAGDKVTYTRTVYPNSVSQKITTTIDNNTFKLEV